MKIFPLTFSCPRDSDLMVMLVHSLKALKDDRLGPHSVVLGNTDWPGDGLLPDADMRELGRLGCKFFLRGPRWGNGCHWNGGLMKIAAIRAAINVHGITDDDYVLGVDSDVLFTHSDIFDELGHAGLAGPMQVHLPPVTGRFGPWSHVSGCCMFIRGDIARMITELPQAVFSSINEEFRRDNLWTNEDILVSYMACYVGAIQRPLNHHLNQDPDAYFRRGEKQGSFFHFNMPAGKFLGVDVTGKWDIPKTLRSLGLYTFDHEH